MKAVQALQSGRLFDDVLFASGTSLKKLLISIGGNVVMPPFLSTAKSTQNHIPCWKFFERSVDTFSQFTFHRSQMRLSRAIGLKECRLDRVEVTERLEHLQCPEAFPTTETH